MKYFSILAIVILTIIACTSKKELTIQENEEINNEDSVSYELIVLDPGFESWFLSRSKPANFHSQAYYESWNQRYVNAWNYQRMGYRYSQLIYGNIDYDFNTNYGLELNHKLFYYFIYVENVLDIKLIPDGPKTY
ncbi:DUF6146 family protein [Mangrovibacterium lignilyticum]|uniref:DUF6146 family protein n=1 Tax=Mangrovibacterium lignilyticum TaxID=2668052 RepID=UPI0013D0B9DE|nr:DUF6146 family protein [Mangrovibacterium lignilyticum]